MPVARRLGGIATVEAPSIRMSPPSGSSKPAMQRSAVDLPQPEGPSRQRNSPSATSSDIALTATVAPKRRVRDFRLSVAIPRPFALRGDAGGEGAAVEHPPGEDQQNQRRHPENRREHGAVLHDDLPGDQRQHDDRQGTDIRYADQQRALDLVEGVDEGQEQSGADRRRHLGQGDPDQYREMRGAYIPRRFFQAAVD